MGFSIFLSQLVKPFYRPEQLIILSKWFIRSCPDGKRQQKVLGLGILWLSRDLPTNILRRTCCW
uniref:Uncharacterized protein n=1 Tax=Phtheirospermum japonicum TaxID=374723 RepID=A0A830BC02_9LAMI